MEESERPDAAGSYATPQRNLVTAMVGIGSAVLVVTTLWYALWLMLSRAIPHENAAWHYALPTLVLTLIWLVIHNENKKWWRPFRLLMQLLASCRAGQTPIEELSTVGGEMACLANEIQSLLRDLRTERQLTAKLEAELGQRVANRTSALERQMSSLRVQATRDALTGLHNRRMLEEALPRMIQTCRESHEELSVLAIDVDNFKPLNDSLGHAVGDEFLRSVAQILRSGIREADIAIRCGGDEFIVLMPGCPLNAARTLEKRLTAMVDALAKTLKATIPPGLSVGVASMKHIPGTLSIDLAVPALLEVADKHLYIAKAARKRAA